MNKTAALLKHLQKGHAITPWKAWNVFRVYRLADVIYKFRRRKMNIETIKVTRNGEEYAKYRLISKPKTK